MIYLFRCAKHGDFDRNMRMQESHTAHCPVCDRVADRVFTVPVIVGETCPGGFRVKEHYNRALKRTIGNAKEYKQALKESGAQHWDDLYGADFAKNDDIGGDGTMTDSQFKENAKKMARLVAKEHNAKAKPKDRVRPMVDGVDVG
jgi:hypothetical protein